MADEVEQENFQGEHLDPLTIDILNNIRSRKVDLSNKCIIVIPSALYHLKHLQYLYLERNYLEELPSCFAENLCQLRWLDIRHNKLKHLPDNISNLTNLKNLLLENNCIERLPLQLGNLKNLSGLNLAKNPLEFPPKDVIESGTKAVLSYLRDFTALEERFKNLDVQANSPELNNNLSSEKYAEAEDLEESGEEREMDCGDNSEKNETILENKTLAEDTENKPLEKGISKSEIKYKPCTAFRSKRLLEKSDSFLSDKTLLTQKTVTKNPVLKKSLSEASVPLRKEMLNKTKKKTRKQKHAATSKQGVTKQQCVLDIFRSTGRQIRKLNQNNAIESQTSDQRPVNSEEKSPQPPVSIKTYNEKLREDKDLDGLSVQPIKLGDMVVVRIKKEHYVPGQPCIGKIVDIAKNEKELLIHYYTGSYDSAWWPMMVRSSPYVRYVAKQDILYTFLLNEDNCMNTEVVRIVKERCNVTLKMADLERA
ncbi:leucine-rich repeat-containing protein 27-like isoform X1 [Hydractinia symbiolongicarpus]|uniref:leucine-rich repeat-containing protein 27-like isoform X1 n=1 Tax=Hydractinia symbiolongicarpus TaxID=13093 RepID=UPI00254D3394|nr:leucine-rich repeat-containing protein 27-like isoform X1 [Hydractinia symbiolongicarpus]